MTIVADEDVLHGLPRIEGTRVSVIHVYDLVVGGAIPAEVADTLDIPLSRVYEALAFYYDHSDEIRHLRREEEALEALKSRTVDPPVDPGDAG